MGVHVVIPTSPRPYHQPNRTTLYPDHRDEENEAEVDEGDDEVGDDDGLAGGVASMELGAGGAIIRQSVCCSIWLYT